MLLFAAASAAKFGIDGLFSRALPSYIIIYIYTHKHGHPMQAALCVYAMPKRREEKQVEIDSDYCLIYDFAPVTLSSDVGLAFSLAPFPSTHFNLFFFFFSNRFFFCY